MGLRYVVGRALDVVDRGNRVRRLRDRFVESQRYRWLRSVSNLVHAGANAGQEAALYERYGAPRSARKAQSSCPAFAPA